MRTSVTAEAGRAGVCRLDVTAANVDHVAILVHDIDEGIADFGALLGMTFNEPQTVAPELQKFGDARGC